MHFLSCFLYLGVSWAYSGRKSDDGFNDRFFADLPCRNDNNQGTPLTAVHLWHCNMIYTYDIKNNR